MSTVSGFKAIEISSYHWNMVTEVFFFCRLQQPICKGSDMLQVNIFNPCVKWLLWSRMPWLTASFFQLDARIHPLTAPLPIHLFNKTTNGMCNAEQVSSITRKHIPSQRPTTGYVHVWHLQHTNVGLRRLILNMAYITQPNFFVSVFGSLTTPL